jgi:hypothetical protein
MSAMALAPLAGLDVADDAAGASEHLRASLHVWAHPAGPADIAAGVTSLFGILKVLKESALQVGSTHWRQTSNESFRQEVHASLHAATTAPQCLKPVPPEQVRAGATVLLNAS